MRIYILVQTIELTRFYNIFSRVYWYLFKDVSLICSYFFFFLLQTLCVPSIKKSFVLVSHTEERIK